jgi:hypothetical protein
MSLRKRNRIKAFVAVVLLGTLAGFDEVVAKNSPNENLGSDFRVEGPFQNQNLAIYLVRGKQADKRRYITLDEAMRAKTVVLRERGAGRGQDQAQVNELEIQNKSDKWLYIQAGDVIEGGKQDRTIGTDVAIPPNSAPQPISAFCVEHGRWTARSASSGGMFQTNTAIVGSNKLKKSIQGEKSQTEVWAQVARDEVRAREAVTVGGAPPAEALSATGTYNGIVENRAIRAERSDYVNSLYPRFEKTDDAVGIVVAINGEVTAADVYCSSTLFHKLARKLIESYALEALLARDQAKGTAAPNKETALYFLIETSKASGKNEKVAPSIHRTTRETQEAVVYEYVESGGDSASKPQVLHKNFVKK